MRAIIERVTCDHCGQVFDFEKLDEAKQLARLEPLTDWLKSLGWMIGNGNTMACDYCPACVRIKAPKTKLAMRAESND